MPKRPPPYGLTIIELLIVIVLITILATLALPYLLGARVSSNETAAITTLGQLVKAQLHFSNAQLADENGNGRGEFGTFGELSGRIPVREASGGDRRLAPPFLSSAFGYVDGLGHLRRGGYCFVLFLPDGAGQGVPELPGGGAGAAVDAHKAENTWCVYAWPVQYQGTGSRTFFTNQSGSILWTQDARYSGMTRQMPCGAALTPGLPVENIEGSAAVNEIGRDGNQWRIVGN